MVSLVSYITVLGGPRRYYSCVKGARSNKLKFQFPLAFPIPTFVVFLCTTIVVLRNCLSRLWLKWYCHGVCLSVFAMMGQIAI